MSESPKRPIMAVLIAVLLVGGLGIFWTHRPQTQLHEVPRSGDIYYAGPLLSKNHAGVYSTDDGKIVPAPKGVDVSRTHISPRPKPTDADLVVGN